MRKSRVDSVTLEPAGEHEGWLDLEKIAQVAVTSEDPNYPIEAALTRRASAEAVEGWRAGGPGEQSIRLVFDAPQRIRRILLRFEETECERTQEFSLRWRPEMNERAQEIVRQQWNFSPVGAPTEIEDYKVNIENVGVMELIINPDISQPDCIATLAQWRIA